jgi:hypothetical protein
MPYPMRLSRADFQAIRAKAAARKEKSVAKRATLPWAKHKKIARPTSIPVSKLEAILWDVFSLYIRLRDIKANGGKCFYCAERPVQCAMHRVRRGKRAVKYDERNVHGGCFWCNGEDRFNPQKYDAIFIRKMGLNVFLDLVEKSKEKCKRSRVEILKKTAYFRAKFLELKGGIK